MSLTESQYEYATTLLKLLGYSDEEKIEQLLVLYDNKYSTNEYSSSTESLKNRKGQHYKTINTYKSRTVNKSIDIIKWELEQIFELKKRKLENIELGKYTSATDLANFVFCNASYSISKTFEIKESPNKSKIDAGTELHEDLRIISEKKYFGFDDDFISNFTEKQLQILKKIKSCKLIFKGHKEEKQIFKNKEKKFIGQPDYIFLDPNNDYFVVEEKYHYHQNYDSDNEIIKFSSDKKYATKDFFPNHLIQLQSYIDYILEYNIKYGLLINWYYHINKNGQMYIHDFTYKILRKNTNTEFLEGTLLAVENFKNTKTMLINNDINLNKCFNCSVKFYCTHKTDNKKPVQFPYNI